ncbi:hypothetical protein OUZ56_003376 [Daphnia magna]|uniref:Uncharacterized protein n=1 Tax=Daphnia magna TaxID=35525 RepID=A0ABR0A8Y8_9CRUS|nr:hypothetical protein OUZ56_003376 [Daphnia magna]
METQLTQIHSSVLYRHANYSPSGLRISVSSLEQTPGNFSTIVAVLSKVRSVNIGLWQKDNQACKRRLLLVEIEFGANFLGNLTEINEAFFIYIPWKSQSMLPDKILYDKIETFKVLRYHAAMTLGEEPEQTFAKMSGYFSFTKRMSKARGCKKRNSPGKTLVTCVVKGTRMELINTWIIDKRFKEYVTQTSKAELEHDVTQLNHGGYKLSMGKLTWKMEFYLKRNRKNFIVVRNWGFWGQFDNLLGKVGQRKKWRRKESGRESPN